MALAALAMGALAGRNGSGNGVLSGDSVAARAEEDEDGARTSGVPVRGAPADDDGEGVSATGPSLSLSRFLAALLAARAAFFAAAAAAAAATAA